jgi:4-carboxymuconolactone decarboxylase
VLYGDVWTRPELSGRDRSIVTVSAFAAGGDAANVDGYLHFARANGLTEDELVELLTHLAFYGGWPQTVTATAIAKAIFDN